MTRGNFRRFLRRGKARLTRDTFLFFFGLAGIIHETIFTHLDRPAVLFAFMAMVGLPAFLRTDEKTKIQDADNKAGADSKEEEKQALKLAKYYYSKLDTFSGLKIRSNDIEDPKREIEKPSGDNEMIDVDMDYEHLKDD